MAHDVFLSYSSQDKAIADGVCAHLERAGIRVWVAPRDILPGSTWAESIIDAINVSRVMVLVFSAAANGSNQVLREVERAVSKGLCIVPFRIENVLPSKSMEYFLSSPHWLDAMNAPLEQNIQALTHTVSTLLNLSVQTDLQNAGQQKADSKNDHTQAPSQASLDEWYQAPKKGIMGKLFSLFDDK